MGAVDRNTAPTELVILGPLPTHAPTNANICHGAAADGLRFCPRTLALRAAARVQNCAPMVGDGTTRTIHIQLPVSPALAAGTLRLPPVAHLQEAQVTCLSDKREQRPNRSDSI